jgi:hypothetical protein
MILLPLIATLSLQTFTLQPSDDIWVYPHASDPAADVFLRVWGADGKAAPVNAGDAEIFSMGYLKWSLAGMPSNGKLKGATLVLTQTAKPGYTLEQAKAMPLQARPLGATFSEPDWKPGSVDTLLPANEKEAFYGSGAPTSLDGDTITISIDLMKGKADFASALAKAIADPKREIAMALTSPMDMAELGRSSIYKIYSREERDEKLRPKLVLTFED